MFLSRIIKSGDVSLGIPVGIDSQYIVKTSTQTIEKKEENIVTELPPQEEEKQEVEAEIDREAIMQQYIKEAQEKSELLFKTEMQKAKDEGIALANKEAETIIDNANKEAESIINEAAMLKQKAADDYKGYLTGIEEEVINLVVAIAERAVNKKIEEDDEFIINLVKESMEKVATKKDVVLKVSAEDYPVIIGNTNILLSSIEGFGDVNIVKEDSLKKGSCIVDTPQGTIDGGIETRVRQLENEIHKILNR